MNKEEALNDFLKGLRVVLNNASAYPKSHPYFKRSVESFKQKLDNLFNFLSPVRINITVNSLVIDGRNFEKTLVYVELATLFHSRKIKSIEFRTGVSTEELVEFLGSIALPVREIFANGGIPNILTKVKSEHLLIEELDYSAFLGYEGEESKDIWIYLFKESAKTTDAARINEFADNFTGIIGKFKVNDFFADEELRESLYNFLIHLKDKKEDKFYKCTKELFRFILKDKNISREQKLDKISIFFKDFKKEELTEALWDEILKEDNFNYLSFSVLSRLFDGDTNKQIAAGLENKINSSQSVKSNQNIRKKVKELFSLGQEELISPFYRHALQSLSEGTAVEEGIIFNRDSTKNNYRYILLNLLIDEKDKKILALISERLLNESAKIIEEKDLEYIKLLFEAIEEKANDDAALVGVFGQLAKAIEGFIENECFEENESQELKGITEKLHKSLLGLDYYLNKIFNEGKINGSVLKLLFRFFPENLGNIYENLEKKDSDIEFLSRFIKSLGLIDPSRAIEILKNIFSFSNNIIKVEALKEMGSLSSFDEEFMFLVLENKEFYLRKEALAILVKNEGSRKKAFEMLFPLRNKWVRNSRLIMESLLLVEELGLRSASEHLIIISKLPFFWNRKIRKKTREVLKEWNVR